MRCPCRHSQLRTDVAKVCFHRRIYRREKNARLAARVIRHTIQFYENVYSPTRQQKEFMPQAQGWVYPARHQ